MALANVRISNLPTTTSGVVVDTDILPIVVGVAGGTGVTSRITVSELRLKLGTNPPAGGRTVTSASTYLQNNAVFNVKDFGAVGDGAIDDTAAVKAAIAAAGNGTVYFPAGTYKLLETLSIKRALRLEGAGGGGSEVSLDIYASVLKFPNNIPGIIIHRHNTNADASGVMRVEASTTGGDNTVIQFLHIQGGTGGNPGAPDTTSHGIMLRARASLMNYKVSGFKGNSVAIIGSVGTGVAATEGAPNGWFSMNSRHTNCGLSGIFTSGSDANAGCAIMADIAQMQAWGINNTAFLNNTFIACQTATNTLGSFTSTGINSASVFLSCYEETDQPGHVISYPSIMVGGSMGLAGAGGTAPLMDALSGMLRVRFGGVQVFQHDSGGAGRDITSQLGGEPSNGTLALFTDSVNLPSVARLKMNGADIDWNYANSTIIYKITGPNTALQFGRSSTQPHSFVTDKLLVGNGGGARRFTASNAAPSTGDWAIGDFVINTAAAVGGNFGWYCTVAGTPGTWVPIGPVEDIFAGNGAQWKRGYATELLTLSTGGTTTDTAANLLPANAIIEAVVARVTTTITTATDWKLGDATTAGRFSAANAVMTAGATAVGLEHQQGSVATNAAGPVQTAAAKVRVTTTGTPGAGVIRITVFYRQFVAPTS